MPSTDQTVRVYQDLADWYDRQGQPQMRDRFLGLAADAALAAGRADEAERPRARLLQFNPHHLLKPYNSLAEALKAPDVQSYVADLRRSYPRESAEHLLKTARKQADDRGGGETAAPPAGRAGPHTT